MADTTPLKAGDQFTYRGQSYTFKSRRAGNVLATWDAAPWQVMGFTPEQMALAVRTETPR